MAQTAGFAADSPMGRVLEALDLGGEKLEVSSGAYDWASVAGIYELFPRMAAIGIASDPTMDVPPSLIPALEQLPDWLGVNQTLASGRSTRRTAEGYITRSVRISQPDASGLMWRMDPQPVDLRAEAAKLPPETAALLRLGFNAPMLLQESLEKLSRFGVNEEDMGEIREALNAQPKLTRAILAACEGGVTLGITLNQENPWPLPFPGMEPLPEPGMVILVPDMGGHLTGLLKEFLREEADGMTVDRTIEEVDVLEIPLPVPLPGRIGVCVAHVDGRMVVTSAPDLMRSVIQRRHGDGESPLAASLHPDLPRVVTNAWVHTPLFRETLGRVGATALQMAPLEMEMEPAAAQGIRNHFLDLYGNFDLQMVSESRGDLRQTVLLHSQPMVTGLPLQTQLAYAPAALGLLTAIAVPGFVRARETAQQNATINHLRMIESAKDQWAIENRQHDGAIPTEADLHEYFRAGFPVCPQGGTFEINPVGVSPVYRRGDTVITLY